jgi:hypothetical protein
MRSFIICTVQKIISGYGDKIREDYIDRVCSTHGRNEKKTEFVGNPERNKALWSPKSTSEYNINTGVKEVG